MDGSVIVTSQQEIIQSLQAILDSQKLAQLQSGEPSAATRRDRLDRCIALLVDHQDELVDALDADFGGRAKTGSRLADIAASIAPLKHARAELVRWMRPAKRATSPRILGLIGAKAQIRYTPKGVVGVISPWNFPIQLIFGPLAGILAAGNRAMIKPSEFTPRVSALLQNLFARYFRSDEIAVVTGGAEMGQAFGALAFDHLIFTGATSIARHVMRAAADNLVPLTLELGGKSPVILGQGADLAIAARRILNGKVMNAGQICLAPDYVLARNDQIAPFVEAMRASFAHMFPNGCLGSPDYTAIIHDRHVMRLQSYLDDAKALGAEIISLDPNPRTSNSDQPGHLNHSRWLAPTLVLNATPNMKIMREEIFGPLLPILSYQTLDEALAHINRGDRPLALYYFGTDNQEEERVLGATNSGGVTINDVIFHVAMEDLPFGGIGPSGMGYYHGHDGFLEFSHRRSVFRQLRADPGPLQIMRPPFGAALERYLRAQIRK